MSLLPAVPPHIGDGHAANTQFGENFFNRFEPGRLNNRFELRHHNVLVLRLLHGFKSLLRLGSGFHYRAILPGNSTLTGSPPFELLTGTRSTPTPGAGERQRHLLSKNRTATCNAPARMP